MLNKQQPFLMRKFIKNLNANMMKRSRKIYISITNIRKYIFLKFSWNFLISITNKVDFFYLFFFFVSTTNFYDHSFAMQANCVVNGNKIFVKKRTFFFFFPFMKNVFPFFQFNSIKPMFTKYENIFPAFIKEDSL